jgi:hypothetical protein
MSAFPLKYYLYFNKSLWTWRNMAFSHATDISCGKKMYEVKKNCHGNLFMYCSYILSSLLCFSNNIDFLQGLFCFIFTNAAQRIPLEFSVRITLCGNIFHYLHRFEIISWSSVLCKFLKSPFASSLSGSSILPSTLRPSVSLCLCASPYELSDTCDTCSLVCGHRLFIGTPWSHL